MRLAASAIGMVLVALGALSTGALPALLLGAVLLAASPLVLPFARRRRKPKLYLVRTNSQPLMSRRTPVATLRCVRLG